MQDFNLEDWDVPDRLSFSQELYTLQLANKTSWLHLANKTSWLRLAFTNQDGVKPIGKITKSVR